MFSYTHFVLFIYFPLEPKITGSKPVIEKDLANLVLKEGDDICLTSKISGMPEPEVEWQKDNKNITADYRTKFESGKDGEYKLLIKNGKVKDAGRYSIIARNASGEMTSTADIVVSPPER